MPRLFYFTPYNDAGLGEAYNQHAALLPNDDDWAVFMDFDAMAFCSQNIESQLQEAIRDHPEFQVFTAMTNRLCERCQQQVQGVPGVRETKDLVWLKRLADHRARLYRGRVTTIRGFFAGFFFAFPKRIWKRFPFPTVGSQRGKVLGIDSAWSRTLKANGIRVGLLEGIVITHFYRLDTGEQNVTHLKDPAHNQRIPDAWGYRRDASLGRNRPPEQVIGAPSLKQWYLNPAMRPPGGYRYTDSDGIVHFASDFNGLVKVLSGYRERVGKPLGNPHEEIMSYYARKYPRYCVLR